MISSEKIIQKKGNYEDNINPKYMKNFNVKKLKPFERQ